MRKRAKTNSDLSMVSNVLKQGMKLRPMDFAVLAELEVGRNLAANIYMELDASRQYINERLTLLEDWGLVDRVGPNPRAGLYEITELGSAALENKNRYGEEGLDFEEYIKSEIESGR